MDHSIFGAAAYILREDVAVAYSGDLRLSGRGGDSTREFARAAKEAAVLIIEGARAGRADPQDGEKNVLRLWLWHRPRRFNIALASFPAAKGGAAGKSPGFEREHHASGRPSPDGPAPSVDRIDPDRIGSVANEARGRSGESFEGVMLAGEGVGIEFWMGSDRVFKENEM